MINVSIADYVIQKTILTIERNSFVHKTNEICAEVLDTIGKANGLCIGGTDNIKEMLGESLQN